MAAVYEWEGDGKLKIEYIGSGEGGGTAFVVDRLKNGDDTNAKLLALLHHQYDHYYTPKHTK